MDHRETKTVLQFLGLAGLVALGVYLAAILAIDVALSFSWVNGDDTSFLYYLSWLINEQGYKPYLQLYDTSFPGTFLAYMAITRIFGYSDLSFHLADIAILAGLLAITWLLLKPIHTRVAFGTVLVYGIYYVTSAGNMHMQRDYLAILPAALALLAAQHVNTLSLSRTSFLIGFLFALSASIKPHFAVGWPVVWLAAMLIQDAEKINLRTAVWFKGLAFTLVGFLCWGTVCVLWLVACGSWTIFVEMATKYLPLYLNLDGGHHVTVPWRNHLGTLFNQMVYWPLPNWILPVMAIEKNWPPVIQNWVIGIKPDWVVCCLAATWALMNLPARRQQCITILALLCLCFLYVLYVALGSKGWNYHWMPFWYFDILCVGLFLVPLRKREGKWYEGFVALVPVFVMVVYCHFRLDIFMAPQKLVGNFQRIKSEYTLYPVKDLNTEDLVSYLKERTHPGEKIELRVTGTAGPFFRALLATELVPTTRFQLHLMLYRDADNDYIHHLQQVLLGELARPPRFLLDDNQFSLLANRDGSSRFPEYEAFLRENYVEVYDDRSRIGFPYQFIVYGRRIDAGKDR